MKFRLANKNDKKYIKKMYEDGTNSLKREGIDQWQGIEAPNLDEFETNIMRDELFVLEDDYPIGTALLKKHDDNYNRIYEGNWIGDDDYIAIHRVAILEEEKNKKKGRALLNHIENYCRDMAKSLRIDTHEENKKMQALIKACNYKYCGIIYLENGKKRLAYEKMISR